MTPDQSRLARRAGDPALTRLHRALSRLSGVLTVMNTGAHPDDEHSDMLAWFRYGLGHRVVLACSTRGEGGQNALGPERGGLLGLIRTREMEEAARVLDADIAWLGFGPDDPVHDFGFSKNGDDTYRRWGEERVVARMALAYRRWRPDVAIPTFLDVPGQHGHHRAMTRAAHAAIALAADPAALSDSGLAPWRVSHFYLPAWSGAGSTYDDTEPPPPATLRLTGADQDAATGASYGELGEWSRRFHASQGMGWWKDRPAARWDLHLLGGGDETRLAEGLPATLTDLAALAGPARDALIRAATAIAAAQAAFPQRAAILDALAEAHRALAAANALTTPGFTAAHGHRLDRKAREIDAALAEAAGLDLLVVPETAAVPPGGALDLALIRPVAGLARAVTATLRFGDLPGAAVALDAPRVNITLGAPRAPSEQFHAAHDALGGNGPLWAEVAAEIAGCRVRLRHDPETAVAVVPAQNFGAEPAAFVRRRGDAAVLRAALTADAPDALAAPAGWAAAVEGGAIAVTPPADAPEGLVLITPGFDGQPATSATSASYPHIGAVTLRRPASLPVLTLDLALPAGARVAWIGSGEATGRWLQRIGVDVTFLDPVAKDEDFTGFTTVMVGVVAFGNRPDLRAAIPRLHRFVAGGGHLVTFYQRPDQGWDAATTPPLPLTIGTPSLRWRVTDPAAPVTLLAPDHPLLAGPNRIAAGDFDGWDKERGLYFAANRDPAYQPLLAMADPGEAPLTGALVSARVGRGRHSHVSLVLHHQLDRLVPGAFRLLANLAQPA